MKIKQNQDNNVVPNLKFFKWVNMGRYCKLIEDIFIRSIKGCIITASLRQDPAATKQFFFFFPLLTINDQIN